MPEIVNGPKWAQNKARLNNTKSVYHQFPDRRGKTEVIKRYTKSVMYGVTFMRQNPDSLDDMIDGMLITRDNPEWYPSIMAEIVDEKTRQPLKAAPSRINLYNYADDVIELYSWDDVSLFEEMNAQSFASGVLVDYDADMEYVYSNNGGGLIEDVKSIVTGKKPAKRVR